MSAVDTKVGAGAGSGADGKGPKAASSGERAIRDPHARQKARSGKATKESKKAKSARLAGLRDQFRGSTSERLRVTNQY